MFHMRRMIFKQFKIFYTIIRQNTIFVMNNLRLFKKSSKLFFNNISVFSEITIQSRIRVVRFKNQYISSFISYWLMRMANIKTFFRTILTAFIRVLRRKFKIIFPANSTSKFNFTTFPIRIMFS